MTSFKDIWGWAERQELVEAHGNGQQSARGEETPKLTVVSMRDVRPQKVSWLWPMRIPKGKLTIVAGDPGLGKSYMSLDIGARVSQGGPWPDGGQALRGDVLLVSAEDGLQDTIRPRLDLLGADISRIHSISITVRQGDKEIGLSLEAHLLQLEETISQCNAGLIVFDPLLALMGQGTDTHRSSDVRSVLAPLAAMAERTECAVLAVMHPNKNSSHLNSTYRITGSLDFVAAARSVLVVGKHPDDANRRVLAPVKSNLSAPPQSLAFRFAENGCFTWDGIVDLGADAILAPPAHGEKSELEDAKHFLLMVLDHGDVEAKKVREEAKQLGISGRTLDRAKATLAVESYRVGHQGKQGGGIWYWRLPAEGD